ncbi:MAG TPA: Ppx/GppA phosphatase family protein [Acidimicrobiales bacterium]|nr:Ppx/GppA phosphatase family protein [Acidimicrobiales bacterium]
MTGAPVAAIDCGTNSTRLLVAAPDGDGGLRTVTRLMRITRLGAGVDRTRALDPAAVARTQAVLEEYRTVMDDHGVAPGRVRVAATSAARDATDRQAWFDQVVATVGVAPELLIGTEEAALSFRGATAGLDPARGPFLVVDLGGGSTELAWGTERVEASMSLEIGCVRLTERFIASDPPRPEELTAAITYAEAWFDDVLRDMPGAAAAPTVIGLAGTVSAVAAVEIGLATYDRDRLHHFTLTKEAAEDVFRTLATEARADRVHNPGLEEARADVIIGGCCALVALYRRLGLEELLVSEADILDGLALSLLG